MHRLKIYGPLLLAVVLLILGCNNSKRGMSFNDKIMPPVHVGQLRVRFPTSMAGNQARQQAIQKAIQDHFQEFNATVATTIQLTYNVQPPTSYRDVYVYDVPYINSPTALAQQGYVNLNGSFDIHVVAGHCDIVPEMTNMLTRSYYFPYGTGGNAAIWASVAGATSTVVANLKIQRFCPH